MASNHGETTEFLGNTDNLAAQVEQLYVTV